MNGAVPKDVQKLVADRDGVKVGLLLVDEVHVRRPHVPREGRVHLGVIATIRWDSSAFSFVAV